MSEVREALNALNVTALIQKIIDPRLLEYQRRLSPLVRSIESRQWGSDTYYFNTRTQRPGGGFVTDGGARAQSASTYVQASFKMAHLQTIGGVTGFAQEVTRDLIGDLQRQEIEGAIQSLLWDTENAILWGSAGATANGIYPQFDGLDVQVSQFSPNLSAGVPQNAIDCAGAALSFSLLNRLIDTAQRNAAMPVLNQQYELIGSTTMISKLSEILTNTQQRVMNTVTLADSGLNVEGYRGLPLIATSFLSSGGLTMGTVTAATATTGGSLGGATYYYRVAAIIARLGEQVASAEVSQVTTGSTSTVTLSFTPPTGFEGGGATLYKVFRSTATGTESLLGYVDAVVGTAADGITPLATNSIVDTGTALIPQSSGTAPAILPTAYVGTNTGHLPRVLDSSNYGCEDVYLIARTPDFVLRPYVRDIRPIPVYPTTTSPDTLPFALVSDTCLATRAPKYLARLRNVSVSL